MMPSNALKVVLLSLTALLSHLEAAENPQGQVQAPELFKELGDGVFLMGGVRIETKARQVTFPATVNMNSGQLEYLLVTASGKVHESLLATEIEPYHLQAAMLLLGVKETQQPNASEPTPSALNRNVLANLPEIEGNPVQISCVWEQNGKRNQAPAEHWILKEPNEPVPEGPWTYSGSRFFEGSYMAQELGSIISLVKDPDAMINNPRPGNADDKLWIANEKVMPPLGTAVEIRISLANKSLENKDQKK